jgi:hypothetical protein
LWVTFAAIALGAVGIGVWVASGDDDLVPNQAELEAVLDTAVDGLTLPERQLSGVDTTCLKPIDECGPALVADYQLGSIDEVCAMVEQISLRMEVQERDDEACWVAGRLDGRPLVVEVGVGNETADGAPLTLIVV